MYDRELGTLLDAVRAAARITEWVRRHAGGPTLLKADDSPVTAADLASQAWILRALARDFPEDAVVAEEDAACLDEGGIEGTVIEALSRATGWTPDGNELRAAIAWRGLVRGPGPAASKAPRVWYLDPVDGTEGFCKDLCYAIALGLCDRGRPSLGILAVPNLRSAADEAPESLLFWAARGSGAWFSPLAGGEAGPMTVSGKTREPLLVGSRAHGAPGSTERLLARLPGARFRSYDSQAKYALVALGRAELYYRAWRAGYEEKAWDHLAGLVLVEEAGGRVSEALGRPLGFDGPRLIGERCVLASNGRIHEDALAAAVS